MNPAELRETRAKLRLTPDEAAQLLDLKHGKLVQRMEREGPSGRPAPVRVVRLYRAYLDGYRPPDWPERLVEEERRIADLEGVRTLDHPGN